LPETQEMLTGTVRSYTLNTRNVNRNCGSPFLKRMKC
jgi:hypothetical protein